MTLQRKTGLRAGAKSVERGSTFANRGEGLQRSRLSPKARKRDRRRELQQLRDELRAVWLAHASSMPCPITGAVDGLDAHHVCEQQQIKRAAAVAGYTPEQLIVALYDTRNCVGVEHLAHLGHHAFARQGQARIPRAVVLGRCPDILAFAAEHGLVAWFDRAYPEARESQ